MTLAAGLRPVFELGALPRDRRMTTVDERIVRALPPVIFALARNVARWPAHLSHYRYVRFRERAPDGGGLVEMSAVRPFGPFGWPAWWLSEMSVIDSGPAIRFRHVGGITRGMDVEWQFREVTNGTHVRIVHVWDGPRWPLIGTLAATRVIGPLFVSGIASRTLEGLATAAEKQ